MQFIGCSVSQFILKFGKIGSCMYKTYCIYENKHTVHFSINISIQETSMVAARFV